jgi:hypothetical protein
MNEFFGKYRGKVENNVDPLQQGRVQVSVPAIYGDARLAWAMPCAPDAGKKVGLFLIPPKGANVWVEFEAGNIDYPIWSGCFWDRGEVPSKTAAPDVKVLKTEGIEVTLSDVKGAGGITLKTTSPAVTVPSTIVVDSKAIQITMQGAKLRVTPTAITISLDPGSLKIAPASVELKHGGASAALQQFKVTLNKGALEVM